MCYLLSLIKTNTLLSAAIRELSLSVLLSAAILVLRKKGIIPCTPFIYCYVAYWKGNSPLYFVSDNRLCCTWNFILQPLLCLKGNNPYISFICYYAIAGNGTIPCISSVIVFSLVLKTLWVYLFYEKIEQSLVHLLSDITLLAGSGWSLFYA